MVDACFRPVGFLSLRMMGWLWFVGLCAMAQAGQAAVNQPTPCQSGFVQGDPSGLPFMRVALHRSADASTEPIRLDWLGHSSFQLFSPAGLRLLMDPNGLHPSPAVPDVVTVSNLHQTHRAVGPELDKAMVLWGMHPEHGWQRFVRTIRDIALFNVPSYNRGDTPEPDNIQNSIFVFRVGGLCIVHLGNLRHVLTRPQLVQIGTPDVLMIPIDGFLNLDYPDIVRVITLLQPRLIIPMHIEAAQQAESFVRFTDKRYPVRRLRDRTLWLSQAQLPSGTEIVMFGH
jgi:L-ascorbate metabolism protein UlaG (beta-lactamase superfamily)